MLNSSCSTQRHSYHQFKTIQNSKKASQPDLQTQDRPWAVLKPSKDNSQIHSLGRVNSIQTKNNCYKRNFLCHNPTDMQYIKAIPKSVQTMKIKIGQQSRERQVQDQQIPEAVSRNGQLDPNQAPTAGFNTYGLNTRQNSMGGSNGQSQSFFTQHGTIANSQVSFMKDSLACWCQKKNCNHSLNINAAHSRSLSHNSKGSKPALSKNFLEDQHDHESVQIYKTKVSTGLVGSFDNSPRGKMGFRPKKVSGKVSKQLDTMVDKLVDILTSSHDENRMKLNYQQQHNQNDALNELANHIFQQIKQESATFENGFLQDSLEASCRKIQIAPPT